MLVLSVKESAFLLGSRHFHPNCGAVVHDGVIYIPQLVSSLHALYRAVLSVAKPAGGSKPGSIAIPYFAKHVSSDAKCARVATGS